MKTSLYRVIAFGSFCALAPGVGALDAVAQEAADEQGEPEQVPPPQEWEAEGPRQQSAEQQQAMQGGVGAERELDDERAREHYRIATRYYDEGRFREAAEQFQEAYELSRRPELLYNTYVALREANMRAEAAVALDGYLRNAENIEDREHLEARLAELRRDVQAQEQQETELQQTREAAEAARIRAERLQQQQLEYQSAGEAWPWVVFGVGVVAVLVGVGTGVAAQDTAGSIADDCPRMTAESEIRLCNADTQNLESRQEEARVLAAATDGLLFGGAAIAATGLILSLLFGLPSGPSSDDEGDESVQAACGLGGCQLWGRF